MGERGAVYFCNGKTELQRIAAENPGYARIYMSAVKRAGVTDIVLSKQKGETLYILSSVERRRYRDYFEEDLEDAEAFGAKEREDEGSQPSKKMKQSTLLGFVRK